MTDATEKLVDDILRIGAEPADPTTEPVRAARIYHKTCILCGADFAAKSPAALYCPDCVRKRRIDGGRKSAEKAKPLREPDGTDREAEKQKRARQIEDAVHKLEAVQAEKDGPPRASGPTGSAAAGPHPSPAATPSPEGKAESGPQRASAPTDARPGAAALEADVEVLADMEAQICLRHGLTFGQLAEAVAALRHYKAVLERLGSETKEEENES